MPRHTDRPSRLSRVTKPQTITRWVPRPLEQLEDRLTPSTVLTNTPAWLDGGPNNVSAGELTNIPGTATNSSVIGAVQAVTPDLSDPLGNTLYAGGVNGGVWKTTNALSAAPVWVPLTDIYPSLSVSAIAINPDNNQQILAGIGGTSDGTYSIDPKTGAKVVLDSRNVNGGVFGTTHGDLIGALYSADGGASWKILSNKIGGQNVVGVAVRGTNVANSYLLVATDQGLYRSTDTGTTFTQISGTGILPATGVFDLAADPGAPVSVVSAASWNSGSNTVTITTVAPHALSIGQRVTVTGVNSVGGSVTGYNGTFTVTNKTATTFTYTLAINPGTYVSGGTATSDPTLDPLARSRFYIAMKSVAGTATGVGGSDIYRSDDGGLTWGTAPVTSPTMRIGANTTNVQISVFNSGIITNNIVYVAVQNNNPTGTAATTTGNDYAFANRLAQTSTITWSPNQGGTWTRMDAPRTQTPAKTMIVFSDSAGVVTVLTGVRHHLRTGDVVTINNVFDAGTPPSLIIPQVCGIWKVTVIDETTFTLNSTLYTGTYLDNVGRWTQVLGAGAGERAEFFDLTADRFNSNIVYLGTDRTAASSVPRPDTADAQFYNYAAAGPITFTSPIWIGDRFINPTGPGNSAVSSAQWSPLVNSGTSNGSAPPADVRDLVMDAAGRLIVATGGGIYKLPPSPTSPSWTSINGNLEVGNIASVAYDAQNNSYFAGTIDTQGISENAAGSLAYTSVFTPSNPIVSATFFGQFATITTSTVNTFAVNQTVTIKDVTDPAYNGIYRITQIFSPTQFEYRLVRTPLGASAGGIADDGVLRDRFFDQANVFRVLSDNSLLSNTGSTDSLTKRYYVGSNFSTILRQTVNASGIVTGSSFLNFASTLTTTTSFSGLNFADRQLINANETVHIAMALNQNDPRRAIFGYNGLYEDADPSGATPTGSIVNDVTPAGMTGTVESLLYGGKRAGVNYNQVVYMTTTTGQLWVRSEFGPVFTNITAALTAASGQTGSIYSVVGDPDNYRHIFVAQGGKILETKDFGATFVDISDNLIGPPTADGTAGPGKLTTEIRSLAIFDSNPGVSAPGDLTLVAGGRGGVYRLQTSTENNGGSWTEYGRLLPNTVVNDLQLYNNKVLIAGTAGRGIWTIPDVTTTIDQEAVLIVTGTAGADVITISVDPNNSNIILVFDGTVTTEWTRGSFSAVQVNGLGGADQVIIDSTIDRITHVPIAGGTVDFVNFKITVDAGGDAGDNLRIIDEGVTTARQLTITNTTVGNGIGDTIFNGSGQIVYTGLGLGTIDISTGSGDDNYILTSLMPGQTILRGNDGSETYNIVMDPVSTSVLTILETGTTGTDAINVTGTTGADNFTTTSAQVLLGTSAVTYSGIEALAVFGNNGDDTFNINGGGGTVSNTFDGQDGSDTYIIPLDPTTPKTYVVADTGAAGTDALNITGTAAQDTFNITSAQVLLGLGIVNYSGIENLNIDGLVNDDIYNIAQDPASSTIIGITDVSGIDALNVTGTLAADVFTVSPTQILLGASTILYSGIENLAVLGGNGNDTFNVAGAGGTVSNSFDGGTGGDTYNVSMNPATPTVLTINDTGVGGPDALNITGTAADDLFSVGATSVLLGFERVDFTPAIEALQVSGGAGNDTFVVATQAANANTAVAINGGSGNDILAVRGTLGDDDVGVDVTSGLGDGSFTGLTRSLNFTDIQTLGFDGVLGTDSLTWRDRTNTAYGTAINPESGITYTPTGADSGSLRVGDGSAFPSLQFRNINASFTVNGDPTGSNTRDVITVLGVSTAGSQSAGETTSADGSDTFVITDRSVSLTNAALGVLRRVDFAPAVGSSGSPTFSTILVKGGNEAVNGDRFTATPSRLANIVIDGMNPTAGAAADQLTFVSNGTTNTFPTSDTKYGVPQTRIFQTVDNSGLGFLNIENVTVFDPSRGGEPPLINVTGLIRVNEGAPYTLNLGTVTDPGRVVSSYTVHWGDGGSDTYGTNGGKLHTYADGPNTFAITVDIVDQFGLHSNVANPVTNVITVVNVAPTIAVAFGSPVVVGLASSVTLGVVTDPGQDTVASYVVRWGDGATDTYSTGGVKTHVYAAAGSYAVTVDLVDEDGSYANRGGTTVTVLTPQVNDPNKLNLTVAGVGPDVLVYNTDGTTRFGFRPYEGYTGNITVASGDITGDGIDDIVTGVESQISHVKVFDGATGIEIASFLAYEGFKGGVTVAVGDVLGTGHAQIITGAGPGGGPHVKVFNIAGGGVSEVQSFFAYDGGYLGGVTVGAGRLDGSGHEMIVTGARTGSSHVKAFDVTSGAPIEMRSFFAFDAGFAGGVNVAAGNGDIAVGAGGSSSNGHVKVFRYTDLGTEQSFFAFPSYEGGARVAFGSRGGTPTLVTGVGSNAPPRFKVFRLADLAVVDNFFIGNVAFDGGIYVG